jgi:predicted  nucleic acid-binding Zn-ribbon protein
VVATILAFCKFTARHDNSNLQANDMVNRMSPEPQVQLDSDVTFTKAAAPSIVEYDNAGLSIMNENGMNGDEDSVRHPIDSQSPRAGNSLVGSNFALHVTSFTENIPLWTVLLAAAVVASLLGTLLCIFPRTRSTARLMIKHARAQLPSTRLRLPVSVTDFLRGLWYWTGRIFGLTSTIAEFVSEDVRRIIEPWHNKLGLVIIFALLFDPFPDEPDTPTEPPQLPQDATDGNDPADSPAGGGGPDSPSSAPSKPPSGGNPQMPPAGPRVPDSNLVNPNQGDSESPSDDGEDEQWFDILEEPTADDDEQWADAPEKLTVSDEEPPQNGQFAAVEPSRMVSTAVQTEDSLTVSEGLQTDVEWKLVSTKLEELAMLKEQEKNRQEEVEKLRDGIDAAQAELEQSKKTVEQHQQETAELKDALNDTKQDLDRAERCCEASERSKSRIQQSYNEVCERRREDEAGVARLVARVRARETETFNAGRAAARAQEESVRHRLEIVSLRNTNSRNEGQIEDLQSQVKKLDRVLADAGDRAKAANSTIERKDGAISDKQTTYTRLQSALEDEKKKHQDDQKHQGVKYKALENKHKTFSQQAKASAAKHRQRIDDAVNAVQEQSKKTISDLRDKLEKSESAATSKKSELASVKKGRDNRLKDKTAADSANKIAEDTVKALRDEKVELSGQLASAKSSNQKLENEIEELKKKIAALEGAKLTSTAAQPAPPVQAPATAGSGDASMPALGPSSNSSPSENVQDKPAGSNAEPAPASLAPGSLAHVLDSPAGHGASTPANGFATAFSKAPENAHGKPVGSVAALVSAPVASGPVAPNLAHPAGGDASTPVGGLATGSKAPENADGRPAGADDIANRPKIQPRGTRGRGNANPLGRGFNAKKKVPENVRNKPLGLFSTGLNGTAVLPGLTALLPPNGFGVGASGLLPHTPMFGVENTPPTQPRRTPEFVADPQRLRQQTGNGAAAGAAKPDVEMGEPENAPPATSPANPQTRTDSALPNQQNRVSAASSTSSLLAIQIGRQIRRLEDQLANLERKRKSTAEEVEIFTARHEVAHNEEVGITRASLNAAESALKDLDDQIKALKDQIEHLRKKV